MKHFNRRTFVQRGAVLAGMATALLHFSEVAAQAPYPKARPITIVVPHAPGGAVDGVARALAEGLAEELKQSVIVENRPGASGMIGAASVARADPDGYTLYFNASIHAINPLLYKSTIKYDAVKDFTPIGMVAQGALILGVNPQVPAKTVQELVGVMKASPDKYSTVTSGYGSAGHLGIAQFLFDTGLSKLNIPIALYKGTAPAMQDLVGGQVHAMMDPMLSTMPQVKAGKVRALAVTSHDRSPLLPDVPTMREAGLKDFEFYSWYGLWSPAKLPEPVLKTIEAATAKAAKAPALKAKLTGLGFDLAYRNSADFGKFINAETVKYQGVIDRASIKIE
jgi:tripartite-type tricarboxylate transporter receptor subunit TctC